MNTRLPSVAGVWLVGFIVTSGISSQVRDLGSRSLPQTPSGLTWEGWAAAVSISTAAQSGRTRAEVPTVLSALVPGAGQHLLGQHRKWAYAAIEVLGWILYLDRRSAGGRSRDAYRDFAWNQARIPSGPRRDGDFTYYEALTKWERSGAFDRDPAATGVQPETDPSTFNGSIWSLATQIFFPGGTGVPINDPQYQRALEYYDDRAYETALLWDWTGTADAQNEFSAIIHESDEGFRQATNALGALIANHVLSAVDVYLSARGVPTPSEARFAWVRGHMGQGWMARVKIRTPR